MDHDLNWASAGPGKIDARIASEKNDWRIANRASRCVAEPADTKVERPSQQGKEPLHSC